MAKYVAHHSYELKHPFVVNIIKDTVGLFIAAEYVFFPKNGQMLGDIALASAYLFNNVLDAYRFVAQNAQNF